jgi:hypothetical protein
MYAWSQLDFATIPVSISAVSSRKLPTYILLDFKIAKWAETSNLKKLLNLCGNQLMQHLATFVFVPSVFGEKFPTAKF